VTMLRPRRSTLIPASISATTVSPRALYLVVLLWAMRLASSTSSSAEAVFQSSTVVRLASSPSFVSSWGLNLAPRTMRSRAEMNA